MREKTHIMNKSEIKPNRDRYPLAGMLNRALPARRNVFGAIASLAAMACVQMLSCPEANASLMTYEGYNYSTGTGNVTGSSGGYGWNGVWQTINGAANNVQAASLVAGANAPTGYDALSSGNSVFTVNGSRTGRLLDTSPGGFLATKGYIDGNGNVGADGKTIYISFMQQPNGTDVYYEFEFHRGSLGDGGRMGGVGNDAGGNNVNLRVQDPPGSNGNTMYGLGAGNTGVNFYVVRIDFKAGNDDVYVYRNPTSATEPVSATVSVTNAPDRSFNGISLGAFANSRTVAHDEIRIGETWADVTAGASTYGTGNWDGGGTDGNWTTPANWVGDVVPSFATALTFAGNTRLNNTNDFTGVTANGITFDSAAGAFSIAGNPLRLGVNNIIGFSGSPASPVTQTLNLPVLGNGNLTVTPRTNGNLTFGGGLSGSVLTQTSPGNVGVVTLNSNSVLTGLLINGGTNRITGNVTVNLNNTRFCLADASSSFNATMIIENGANLSVSGTGGDAGVIGRDGGVGTVIQNGGTFSFNIPNNNKLFIVATGNANSRGAYNMNGGLFDMNNNILSPGLGAGGVTITGYVNQVGGVITNVGQLLPGWNTGQNGRGIYNLTGGKMYINGIGGVGITSQSGKYNLNLGGGTLSAGASWSSALDMSLTGINGPVTFDPNGNAITLTGIISGSGGLTVNGAGTLVLNGANTYTGNTVVSNGSTLEFDVTGSCPTSIRVANGGTLNLNYAGTYVVSSLYTNGVVLPSGTYNSGNLPGYIIGSGDLQVSSISAGIWDGGGANDLWSTAGNWDNNAVPIFPHALTFAGSTRLNNTNDLSSITISSLTFDQAAGAFTLNGNDTTVSGSIGFSGNPAASLTDTVNFGITFTGNQTIDLPANGNLALNGSINAASYGLVKAGLGTLTLGGASDSFNSFRANGGTNVITGNVTVSGFGGGSFFFVGDIGTTGALVIQPGSSLTVNGGFGDSGVIGRDSGIGTIIQNGGTFTFAPANVGFLFVGASGNTTTRASYFMNGGTFDMGGLTLALGLSANGSTLITGLVSQVNGTIQNVGKLTVGAFNFGPGRGIYSLSGGSIYIGGGGIGSDSGFYNLNLGGGTVGAIASWASSLNMNLTGSNGPVTFDTAGNIINLTGILSGPGGLNVTGGGVLELGGANTFAGDITVNAGTLQLDVTGSSSGALRITNGATLNLNYSGSYVVAGFYTNGVALPFGTYNAGNLSAFITGTGDLVVQGVSSGKWDGGGADNFWNTGANWDGNAVPIFPLGLTFGGSTRLNNTNDLVGVTATSLAFSNTAGAFTLNGNSLGLSGDIGFTGSPASPITQTINLPLTPTANINIDAPANATLLINGDITAAANTVYKTGNGTVTLNGNNTFAAHEADGGTNIITGNTTFSGTGGSRIYVANGNYVGGAVGTLVIQSGATLSVNGNYADAYVIGRDTGIGRLVQNGGTFDYTPANQSYMFIGAGNNAATRGQFDMNGGILNMNGKTLGVGLGVNVAVTGVVNQVSGVITNVNQLFLDSFFSTGFSIVNITGGTMYLGAGGIVVQSGGGYEINLGGGTLGSSTGWSSPLNMTLTGNNGNITFDTTGGSITLSGALSGPGGLTVSGAGILDLFGVNSYTGQTLVNQGTLKLENTNNTTSSLKVAAGAALNLNYLGNITVPSFFTNNVALAAGTYNSGNLSTFITGPGGVQVIGGGGIPTTPTNITFVATSGQLALSWPASYAGWILQTQTNSIGVGLRTNWFDVPGSGSITSTNIPVGPGTPTVFFRLRYP